MENPFLGSGKTGSKKRNNLNGKNNMSAGHTILQKDDNDELPIIDNVTNQTPKSTWPEAPRIKALTLSR